MEHRQPHRHDTILSLTGIRGAAAVLVLAHHLPIAQSFGITGMMPVITNGNYGVELFFLLSGFILTLAHHRDFSRLAVNAIGRFYLARALRVYPLHLVILAMIAIMIAMLPEYVAWVRTIPGFGDAYSLQGFIQTATLTNRIGLPFFSGEWNGPSWSLSAEMVGYAAFPAIVVLAGKIDNKINCMIGVVTLLLLYTMVRYHSDVGVLRMILTFPAGVLLGRMFLIREPGSGSADVIAFLGLAGFLVALSFARLAPLSVFGSAALIYGLALSTGRAAAIFKTQAMVYLGRISFSLYLSHHFVFMLVTWWIWDGAAPTAHPLPSLLAMSGGAIMIAHILYRLIEKPSHGFGRTVSDRLFSNRALNVAQA